MVLGNLGLLLVNRQQGLADALRAANPLFWAIAGVACGLLLLALYLPPAASLFRFAAPPPIWLAAAAALTALMLAGVQLASAAVPRQSTPDNLLIDRSFAYNI